jgi:prephenate dehydrogenase
MKQTEPIAIIGLGLMGGSLALALTRAGYSVSGWDSDPQAVTTAARLGAIREEARDLAAAVSGAQIVFIAVPVPEIAATIQAALPHVGPGAIFSDLGSIKEELIETAHRFLPESSYFVPGHPMTGSEHQGMAAADPFLFQNAAYILIDDPRTPSVIQEQVAAVVRTTGALVLTLTASEHDRIVATVSHLPHLVAALLAKAAGTAEDEHPGTLALAAGGFRDTTRIATSSPELWEGILRSNRERVLEALGLFEAELRQLKYDLANEQWASVLAFLAQAREIRYQVPAKNKGFLTLLHEMVVTIEDRPGTIVSALQYLAEAELNIKDIEILRVREGDGGTLRLALENETAVEAAVAILEAKGFRARKR